MGILMTATMLACSCSSSTSSSSVDPSKRLNALTTSDQQALCDWTAQEQGGYGTIIPCDAGPSDLEVEKDHAACLALETQHFDQPTCTATVGDWMACVKLNLSTWCSAHPPAPTGQCAAIDTGCYGSPAPDGGGD